jgi:hypothetical protein
MLGVHNFAVQDVYFLLRGDEFGFTDCAALSSFGASVSSLTVPLVLSSLSMWLWFSLWS